MDQEKNNICEVVGIFNSVKLLEKAVDELFSIGVDQAEVSVLADNQFIKDYPSKLFSVQDFAHNPETLKKHYAGHENVGAAQGGIIGGLMYVGSSAAAGAVIATGGTLAAALIAAAAIGGAGTLIGIILSKFIGNHHAQYIEEQLSNGGLILWVHLRDSDKENLIKEILIKNQASDVHTHCIPQNLYNKQKELISA
jgi:hypothetical protein